jgi:hypothetical protein
MVNVRPSAPLPFVPDLNVISSFFLFSLPFPPHLIPHLSESLLILLPLQQHNLAPQTRPPNSQMIASASRNLYASRGGASPLRVLNMCPQKRKGPPSRDEERSKDKECRPEPQKALKLLFFKEEDNQDQFDSSSVSQ